VADCALNSLSSRRFWLITDEEEINEQKVIAHSNRFEPHRSQPRPFEADNAAAMFDKASSFASFAASPLKIAAAADASAAASEMDSLGHTRRISIGSPNTHESIPGSLKAIGRVQRPRSLSAGANDFLGSVDMTAESKTPHRLAAAEDAEFTTPPTSPDRFRLEIIDQSGVEDFPAPTAQASTSFNLVPRFKPLDLLLASPVRQPLLEEQHTSSPLGPLLAIRQSISIDGQAAAASNLVEFPDVPASPVPQPLESTPLRFRLSSGELNEGGRTSAVGFVLCDYAVACRQKHLAACARLHLVGGGYHVL